MDASNFDHILRKVVIVPVIALLVGAGILAWQIDAANTTVAQIQTNDARIAQTLEIEQLVIDQETGLRGYEITHDRRLLQRYDEAERLLPAAFDRRRELATNNVRKGAVDALRGAYDTWEQGFADPLIATIQAGGETNDVQLNYQGKLLMDDIRAKITDLNKATVANRDQYVQRWHRQVRNQIVVLILLAIAIGLIIGLYLRNLVKQVSIAFRQSHDVLRIRAEQTFRSEEKLRTTLRSIGDGVITCDADGRVQSMNDTAQDLTGWTEREAREQPIAQVFSILDERTRQPVADGFERFTRGKVAAGHAGHTVLHRRDESDIFVEESGSPILDKHGRLIGIVVVFRDVTLARKSQEALLANEKLAVAGRLAASIAHEIHNPLDSVSNLLFLMDGVATDEERAHFLELAKMEIARVTQISRAMLSLYRESKQPVLIDLREMLESILLLMESRFQALGVHVEHQLPQGLCVHGFPAELRQVFTNLFTNAAEATGPGGTIRLHAEALASRVDEKGMRRPAGALVTVEDNGPGVPANVVASLFQPFFTTKGERGTGLGLWISRGIITKHGGTIELESTTAAEAHGTTLRVFLATDPVVSLPGN